MFENCITLIEYFKFYITKTHCDLIVKYINIQIIAKIIKRFFNRYSRLQLWKNINENYINKFINIILIIKLIKIFKLSTILIKRLTKKSKFVTLKAIIKF